MYIKNKLKENKILIKSKGYQILLFHHFPIRQLEATDMCLKEEIRGNTRGDNEEDQRQNDELVVERGMRRGGGEKI